MREGPWVALLSTWGGGYDYKLQLHPLIQLWPVTVQVQARKHREGVLKGNYAIALWPVPRFPIASPMKLGPYKGGDPVWYHQPGCPKIPATVLSREDRIACILPESHDLPLMVSVCLLSLRLK